MQGHRARKRFGQNFLHDRTVVERIVRAIDPRPGQALVEIGPGLGALTADLIAHAGHVTAVEIDRDLAARLRERFGAERLTLIEGDALQLDWDGLARSWGAGCASSATCPTTSARRCCFTWRGTTPRSPTSM